MLNWGNLSDQVGMNECRKIADQLRSEGWHDKFVEPLSNCLRAIRVVFALLEPRLETWVKGRIALVGDAAHPPISYFGQGAQQGLGDVGVAASLVRIYCLDETGKFYPRKLVGHEIISRDKDKRSSQILDISKSLGRMQADRACKSVDQKFANDVLKGEVLMFGTIPLLMPGSDHDYKEDVIQSTREENFAMKLPWNSYCIYPEKSLFRLVLTSFSRSSN